MRCVPANTGCLAPGGAVVAALLPAESAGRERGDKGPVRPIYDPCRPISVTLVMMNVYVILNSAQSPAQCTRGAQGRMVTPGGSGGGVLASSKRGDGGLLGLRAVARRPPPVLLYATEFCHAGAPYTGSFSKNVGLRAVVCWPPPVLFHALKLCPAGAPVSW